MAHAQPGQLVNTNTRKKRLPTFMLVDTPDVPSTESDLPNEQVSQSPLKALVTVEIVLRLEELMHLKPISIADVQHKSLRQQNQSGRSLLQDEEQASSMSEALVRQFMLAVPRDYWGLTC